MKEKIEKGEGKGEAAMRQKGTDFGQRGETGEKFSKGVGKEDDRGRRKEKTLEGVGQGMADKTGQAVQGVGRHEHHMGKHDGHHGEFNSGTHESHKVHYEHKRVEHVQDENHERHIKTRT